MSGMTCQTTQHYVSEDLNPQQCQCENLKSHTDTESKPDQIYDPYKQKVHNPVNHQYVYARLHSVGTQKISLSLLTVFRSCHLSLNYIEKYSDIMSFNKV